MRNIYDFDNTIFRGDSTVCFCRYVLKRRPALLRKVPGVLWAFIGMALHRLSKTRAKEILFMALLPGLPPEFPEDFWRENLHRIKPFYLAQKEKSDLVISASPEFLLAPAMRMLGIRHLIASPVDAQTGRYRGENCHGEEKVRQFRKTWMGEPFCFYSDSRSDLPMARLAETAYWVRGDRVEKWNLQ